MITKATSTPTLNNGASVSYGFFDTGVTFMTGKWLDKDDRHGAAHAEAGQTGGEYVLRDELTFLP